MKEKSPMKTTSVGCLLDEQKLIGPLFLLKCTKGIFMFHHLPAARLFKQKTPYPPRFTHHKGVVGGALLGF